MSEGESGGSWVDSLPEEIRDVPYIKDADTPAKFAENLRAAANWQGNSIRTPGPDAGEEDIAAFHAKAIEKLPGLMPVPNMDDADNVNTILGKLGRPDTAEEYKLPEGVELSGDALGALKAEAHEMGLTQRQFAKRVESMSAADIAQAEKQSEHYAEQQAVLKSEWGAAYADRVDEIKAFASADEDIPAEIRSAIDEGRVGADFMRWMHKMSQLGEEGGEVRNQGEGGDRNLTPMEAEGQLNEIENRLFKGNNGRPIHADDPQYAYLNKKRIELIRMMGS